MNRRTLLQTSAMAAGLAVAKGQDSAADAGLAQPKLKEGDVILFQGDSITDVRRHRKAEGKANDIEGMGSGYPFLAGGEILREHSKLDLKIYNRGISGNRVPHLQKRWEKDCVKLKPAVVSILIGVNDIWHKMNGKYDGTVDDYRQGYSELLRQTKEALPDTKIVICEPFVMRCGAVKDSWFPEFDQRRVVAKEVAEKSGSLWVPFQEVFDAAIAAGSKPEYWAGDGVHPSLAGHALMAQAWRKVVGI